MSDLTLLFANQPSRSPAQAKTLPAGSSVRNSPFTSKSPILVSTTRHHDDFGDKLNKYLKDGLENENLQHELKKFTNAQKK